MMYGMYMYLCWGAIGKFWAQCSMDDVWCLGMQLVVLRLSAVFTIAAETGDVADAEEEEDDGIPKPSPNADTTILFVRPDTAAAPGGMGTLHRPPDG